MNMKLFLILIFTLFIIASCEKTINFDLNEPAPKLVVEATIEYQQPPIVFLSKSLGYFSQIDKATLSKNFARNAEVYVSNGTLTHKLKEYEVPDGSGNPTFYYSTDSSSLSTYFIGEMNTDYSLRIVSEGQEFNATTHIPFMTRHIDSVFWRNAPPNNPPGKVVVFLRATDPAGYGDYVRYFTKRNSEPFYPGLNSVFDDQVIDGSTYEVEVDRGVDRNESRSEAYNFFDRGDTVTLKICNIDRATYDFWRTMEFTYASVGNPFSSPTKVISNISNGALGYFGGYASQFTTIIIPQ